MKSHLIGIGVMIVAVLFVGTGIASGTAVWTDDRTPVAQTGDNLPPTIISFSADLTSIAPEAVEVGETPALLSWQTVGVAGTDRVVLHAFRLNRWEPLLPEGAPPLLANGSYEITVHHPLNFGPPSYSLMIVNANGQMLDQRVLTIPYDIPDDPPAPQIVRFETDVQALDISTLLNGTARVSVAWEVAQRLPSMNLVFEQVLEGGRAVTVELPRPNLWIPSAGEGVVAPVLDATGEPVRLRLSVVDMRDGTTIAEQLLDPLPVVMVSATPVPPAGSAPTAIPQGGGQTVPVPPAQILAFTAAPETIPRGGTVTVGWQVVNASDIGVWLLDPDGRLSQSAPNVQPVGAWTVTLSEYYTTTVTFMIFATDTVGNQVQQTLTCDVICPYTYFFGGPYEGETCPKEPARTVQAAFQAFENGYMIWRGDTSEIYVLYTNMQLVERYRDTWQGEDISVPETPPQALYQPLHGFGRIWVDNPQVRSRLGWATTLEQGYTMTYQASGDYKYARLYVNWPDGTIVYFVENTWAYK